MIVWSTAVGPVSEYRSGTEVPGSRVEAPELFPSGDAGGDAEADEAGEVVGDGESDGDDEPRRPGRR